MIDVMLPFYFLFLLFSGGWAMSNAQHNIVKVACVFKLIYANAV
jgi:hypothetical protein